MTGEDNILVSVVIVNFNAKGFLRSCLESLAKENRETSLEVIVIDNASTDGSEEELSNPPLPVAFVRNPKNIGLSRANNQGIQVARGRYLLLLNPDVEIMPGALAQLVRFMDDNPETGIVGPKLLNPDRGLQYSCREFYTLPTLLLRRSVLGRFPPGRSLVQRHLMTSWDHASIREVDWLLGAFLLVRREAIEGVGMMDERFFLYFEDVDWCFRMRKAGWKVIYDPDAEAIHHHYRHSAKKGFRQARESHIGSLVKFISKYGGLIGRRSKAFPMTRGKMLTHPTLASRSWSTLFGLLSLGADIILSSGLFWMGYLSRLLLKPDIFPHYLTYFRLYWMTLAAIVLSLFLSGFYRTASRLPIYHQFRLTLRGVLLSGFLILSLLFLIRGLIYSRLFLLLFWAILLPTIMLERFWLYKLNLQAVERGYGRKRTWIFGEDKAGQELYERFLETPELGCEVVGFLSESDENGGIYGSLPVFPAVPQTLKPLVQREGIEQILIPGLNPKSIPRFGDLMAFALEHDIDLRLVHPRSDFLAIQTRLFDVLGVSLVSKRSPLSRPLAQVWKRVFDLLIGLILFFFLLPWMAVIYLLLRLKMVNKPVYKKNIIGKGEKNTEVHRFKIPSEWREPFLSGSLPGLWDVLTGRVSLVGPRAMEPEEFSPLREWERRRFKVAPGLTGLAQVRSPWAFSPEEKILLDLYYIENWTPLWDIEILLETPAVFFLKFPRGLSFLKKK